MAIKTDFRWSGPVRPELRITAAVLGLVFLIVGGLALFENVASSHFRLNSQLMVGVAGIGWGVVFLILAIRGRLLTGRN